MSRTHHPRRGRIYDGNHGSPYHRYPGGSSGIAWRRKYVGWLPRGLHPAERAAMHEDDPSSYSPRARRVDGFLADLWDYDDSWMMETRTAEDLIPGYWDWREIERSYLYGHDDDWYDPWDGYGSRDDDYDRHDREETVLEDDARWVIAWVDGQVNAPPDYSDYSRDYDLAWYTQDDIDEPEPEPHAPLIDFVEAVAERDRERARHRNRRRAA